MMGIGRICTHAPAARLTCPKRLSLGREHGRTPRRVEGIVLVRWRDKTRRGLQRGDGEDIERVRLGGPRCGGERVGGSHCGTLLSRRTGPICNQIVRVSKRAQRNIVMYGSHFLQYGTANSVTWARGERGRSAYDDRIASSFLHELAQSWRS